METIGQILSNGNIEKSYYNGGLIYKNFKAFNEKTTEICYVPELGDDEDTYTYNDLHILVTDFLNENPEYKGTYTNEDLVKFLFESLSWQTPETILNEWLNDDIL